jgi:hypothetical protein
MKYLRNKSVSNSRKSQKDIQCNDPIVYIKMQMRALGTLYNAYINRTMENHKTGFVDSVL